MKRIYVVVMLLVVLVGLIVVTILLRSPDIAKKVTVGKKVTIESNYQKLARGILEWITVQRDGRGLYLVSRTCKTYQEVPGNCDTVLMADNSAHTGLPAIWARYLYDIKVRGKISNEVHENIRDFYKYVKNSYIQTDLWSCKYWYEMSLDERFDTAEKLMMEDMCVKYSGYNKIGEVEFYRGGSDASMVRYRMMKPSPDFSKNKAKLGQLPIDSEVMNFWEMMSAYPTDLVARYQWKKNPDDLKMAEAYFFETANYFKKSPEKFGQGNYCALGNSALDLYGVTQNNDYLEFANDVYTKNLKNEKTLFDPICGLWLKQLYEVTQDTTIPSLVSQIAQQIASNDLDVEGVGKRVSGDGAYLSPGKDGSKGLVKSVRDNGLAAAFLSQL